MCGDLNSFQKYTKLILRNYYITKKLRNILIAKQKSVSLFNNVLHTYDFLK